MEDSAPPEPGQSEIWVHHLRERPDSDTLWSALHDRYQKRILVYAHYRLGQELRRTCDAEDVVNEAWFRIVSHWDRFDYRGPDSLFHWLCLQVRRAILDRRRRRDRQSADKEGEPGEPDLPADVLDVTEKRMGPRTEVMQMELRDRLTGALEAVPALYRKVLVAVLLEGRAPAEVAEEQGRKADTVRKQLARGMEHWRSALGGDPMHFL